MGTRRHGRELALQALYGMEVGGNAPATSGDLWRHGEEPEEARTFAADLVRGVCEERARIDALIAASSEHWKLGRLSSVDLNILRVATYELLRQGDVPARVVIDEAIEIAKRFGSEDSAGFINGVLDDVALRVGAKGRRDGARPRPLPIPGEDP